MAAELRRRPSGRRHRHERQIIVFYERARMNAPMGVAVGEDQSKAGQQASGCLGAKPAGVQRLDVHIDD
jgi:hypothetical protein